MAGLYDIFNNSFHSMGIFQYALTMTGRNLQNIAFPGYHSLENIFTSDMYGNTVLKVERLEDNVLQGQVFIQAACAGQSLQTKNLYNNLTAIFGLNNNFTVNGPNASFPLANQWNQLLLGFQTLATNPAQGGNSVLSAAYNLTNSIHDLAQKLADSRAQGEANIHIDIAAINKDLRGLKKINESLSALTPGVDTGQISVLKDKRDFLLNDLSQYMHVNYKEKNNGVINVFTTQGFELLTDDKVHFLKYDSVHAANGTIDIQNMKGGLPVGNFTISTPDGSVVNLKIHSGETADDLVQEINHIVGLRAEINEKGQLCIASNKGEITIGGSSSHDMGFESKTYNQTKKELTVEGSSRILTESLTAGQLAADVNYIRDDWHARNSNNPYIGQVGKLESQLNSVVHLLMDQGSGSFESILEGNMTPKALPSANATPEEIGKYWQYSMFVPKDFNPGPPPTSQTIPGNEITAIGFKVNPSASVAWFHPAEKNSPQNADHPWGGSASAVVKFMQNPSLPSLNYPYLLDKNTILFPGMSTDGVGWQELISTMGGVLSSNEQTVTDDSQVRQTALQQLNIRMLNEIGVNQSEEQDNIILYSNSYNALSAIINVAKKMEQTLIGLAAN